MPWTPQRRDRRAPRQVTGVLATLCLAAYSLAGCGASPQIARTADYCEDDLRQQRVLLVPLAVSDDLGDQRTGIVLDKSTRWLASIDACERIAETWGDGTLVCVDTPTLSSSATLSELELRFARDEPVAPQIWQRLRSASGADYALLFRPERVASSQEVRKETDFETYGFGGLVTNFLADTGMVDLTRRNVMLNSTDITYTLSASLVNMKTGKLLAVGVHSGGDSLTVKRNLGYAEAPPAAPILEDIMVALGVDVLDD